MVSECEICGRLFTRTEHLVRHRRTRKHYQVTFPFRRGIGLCADMKHAQTLGKGLSNVFIVTSRFHVPM